MDSISHSLPILLAVYLPAFTGSHCPQRDGQAELTWVSGYFLRKSPILALDAEPSELVSQY